VQKDWEVAGSYGADATPSVVLIASTGAVGSPLAEGPEAIETLIAHAIGAR
jgi:hypothetical protein